MPFLNAGEVLLNNVSFPQKEWSNETCGQSEAPQLVGRDSDGGHYNPAGPSEAWELDGESRSEVYFTIPISPGVSEVNNITNSHVFNRLFLCPMDIHQGIEASDDTVEIMGNQNNSLHR